MKPPEMNYRRFPNSASPCGRRTAPGVAPPTGWICFNRLDVRVSGTMRPLCAIAIAVLSTTSVTAQMDADVGARLLRAGGRGALDIARATRPRRSTNRCVSARFPHRRSRRRRAPPRTPTLSRGGLEKRADRQRGNVLGERPGRAARPHLVFSAHLDTVFPEETNVRVTRDGSILRGPGIGDDCRGLAVVLAVIRALNQANVETNGTITFVGTVGEEGSATSVGSRRCSARLWPARSIGSCPWTEPGLALHVAVGSLRYRVTFSGPGGHSYGAFGIANPMHALGEPFPASPTPPPQTPTTFSVGRIGGGTSVNAIPADAWMEVDMQSADQEALRALESRFRVAVAAALAAENARWDQKGRISVTETLVGARPAGAFPRRPRSFRRLYRLHRHSARRLSSPKGRPMRTFR